MFTATFWRSAAERAVRTFCQSVIALLGANQIDWTSLDWQHLLLTSAGAAALSLLTSIAGVNIGDKGTPSLVDTATPVGPPV